MPVFEFIKKLKDRLARELGNLDISTIPDFQFEITPEGMRGDITLNMFKVAKFFREKPDILAAKASEILREFKEVLYCESIKGFVNIEIEASVIHRLVHENLTALLSSCKLPTKQRKTIVVEYSAPNTNKPMHLGHVRNNTLGLAITSILKKAGHNVVAVNLINDRGIHICKSMLAYMRFGNGDSPEKSGRKGDHFVGDYYVKFDIELKRQIAELKKQDEKLASCRDDELFTKTEIGSCAQEMLKKWEAGDTEVRQLWEKMNNWVISGFDETYRRMGIKFDKVYLESQTYLLGKDVIADGIERGIFGKTEDGAVFVDLEKEGFGKKILLRSDGTSVYITQDIGTTLEKAKDFNPDSQIWIVGDEQILHFKILFAILKKLGYKWADSLYHLAYGMVNLPSGKMKSREGTVVDADDLFDQMFAIAKSACAERYQENMPDDIDQRCEIIAMGALKFMLLKFNPKTTIMFDPNASVKFEGDTGPYVQYACTRINSIEKKAINEGISIEDKLDWSLLSGKEEKDLSLRMLLYPKTITEAAEKLDPSIIANYLLDLAKTFSRFYKQFSVLSAENDQIRNARLKLCLNAREILRDGLTTLTIDVPTAM